jgi:hypothetical protein
MLKSVFSKDVMNDIDYPKPSKKEIARLLSHDDAWLLGKIDGIAKSGKGNEAVMARCFGRGEQIRRVVEKIAYAERASQRIDPQFTAIETLESFRHEIAAKADVDAELIFFDKPWKDLPFESKYRQYGSVKDGGAIKLLLRDGKVRDIAYDPSSLAYNVSRWIARVVRIYTLKEKRETLRKVIAEKCPNLKAFLVTK